MESQVDIIRQHQAERLEQVREQTGMIQSDFAAHLDLQPGSYSDIKRGKNGISKSVLKKLEKKLNINIEWLLTGSGEMSSVKEGTNVGNTNEVLIPYKNQLSEGVSSHIDNLFKIIERRDEQIDRLLQSIKERDEAEKNGINKILAMLEKFKPVS